MNGLLNYGTIRTGERGMALIDASRNWQLTKREIGQLVTEEGFPTLFADLCWCYALSR
ncbi:MAG TPA: hypothetical protein VN948_04885 [Terriglobales bacterium]|nr:hypothetical protein [Terriglobales bacterium]